MTTEKKLSELKEEEISAFAYKVGGSIESFIREVTNNLEERNKDLEVEILSFRQVIVDSKLDKQDYLLSAFDQHFHVKHSDDKFFELEKEHRNGE